MVILRHLKKPVYIKIPLRTFIDNWTNEEIESVIPDVPDPLDKAAL